jgi:uncharacterized protein YqeY
MIRDLLDVFIAHAMKEEKDKKYKLRVLRLIKSEYQKYETSGKDKILDDANEIKILNKLRSQWKESIEAFKSNGREVAELELEVKYLESLMPRELSIEEQKTKITEVINDYLKNVKEEDRNSMKHLGAIMKIINSKYPSIGGKLVSEIYKQIISN